MKHIHKRYFKNYLIAPKQQILFGFFIFIFVLIAIGTFSLLLINKIRQLRDTRQFAEPDIDIELVFFIMQYFILTSLVLGVFIFGMNILLTHRIFGSLYAIEKYFKDATEGNVKPSISIRKHDMTHSLVETINRYIEHQRNKNEEEKNER